MLSTSTDDCDLLITLDIQFCIQRNGAACASERYKNNTHNQFSAAVSLVQFRLITGYSKPQYLTVYRNVLTKVGKSSEIKLNALKVAKKT